MKRQAYGFFFTAIALFGFALFCDLKLSVSPGLAENEKEKESQAASAEMLCPKCKSMMEPGFVRDYFDSNSFDHAGWSPAGEKQHLFTYGKFTKMIVYRCSNCGYLEFYAK
jgi:predicted nucleic-acid-binding Zn-ribbon protein